MRKLILAAIAVLSLGASVSAGTASAQSLSHSAPPQHNASDCAHGRG